tara:strand:- start:66 stop:686 length:621 start_codon:yes stop_codon:yes gene_type:complete
MPEFNKVLAFEGEWEFGDDEGVLNDHTSVRTILETLKNLHGKEKFDFTLRRTATREELYYYLERCLGETPDTGLEEYNVIMFNLHGHAGTIVLPSATKGERDELPLKMFGMELTYRFGPKCLKGKVVYFSSCELALDKGSIEDFKNETGASAVIAFTKTIDWVESAAFELILLDWLQHWKQIRKVKESVESEYPRFSDRLGMYFLI